jgi:hypothetical protein
MGAHICCDRSLELVKQEFTGMQIQKGLAFTPSAHINAITNIMDRK